MEINLLACKQIPQNSCWFEGPYESHMESITCAHLFQIIQVHLVIHKLGFSFGTKCEYVTIYDILENMPSMQILFSIHL